jgi:selenide,water dikinase
VTNSNVLVGYETADDAGVYLLNDQLALVQTVDFFTPIVDDPKTFGAIAAVNALSDVWAMGGVPVTALSVVAFPAKNDPGILADILTGGAEKMLEAGCAIVGGHSINDDEVKFGYSVTGTIHPGRIWKNSGAQPGDVLAFTKRIGTGVIGTALKRGLTNDQDVAAFIHSMLQLNKAAAEALHGLEVHGCTDITGFGFLGHAREMALGSNVTLEIDSANIQLLPGALAYARAGALPGGLNNNRNFAADCVEMSSSIAPELQALLYDPQTAGGLLVSLPPRDFDQFLARYPAAYPVGRVFPRQSKPIRVI